MKELLKCFACEGAGFTHKAQGFLTETCKVCCGLGKKMFYSGEFDKEERKEDELELRDRMKEDYDREHDRFEFKKYRNKDLI